MSGTRTFADRRRGADRRTGQRRQAITTVARERRRVVDRRFGGERRSTVERRGRLLAHHGFMESPAEHLRNALQLVAQATEGERAPQARDWLAGAVERIRRALALLDGGGP